MTDPAPDRSDDPDRIRSLVIVGGGTAGWMTAAAFANAFSGTDLSITLVESSDIGTIGVGEATIPTFRRFYARLGMRDADVMRACSATAKLAIRFEGWGSADDSFLHPFGLHGQDMGATAFHQLWLDARRRGDATPIDAYSLGAGLAAGGRMALPQPSPPTPLATYDWALHIDAGAFARLMREWAEASGVVRIDATVAGVELDDDDGRIAAVALTDGRRVAGDFFVDCSGFRSLLLGEALGVGFQDWRRWLPCDAAIAVQTERGDAPPVPYTRAIAHDAGWQWRIPLTTRGGNGIVWSSAHMADDAAMARLMTSLPGNPITEPRRIGFTAGRRAVAWARNCVGIGLSAGFLEPLESTSIALIETAIERLLGLFPDRRLSRALIDNFNDETAQEMERVRDFIILHYKLAGRTGAFWDAMRAMDLPDSLAAKLALWDERGAFVRYAWEMFHPASWLAILAGMERMPRTVPPQIAAIDRSRAEQAMARMRAGVAAAVARAPTHSQFLESIHR